MNTTKTAAGFYGTDSESYYVTPAGRVWAYGSGDFDGVREIEALPADATDAADLMTPEEMADIIGQVQAESGEVLIEGGE